MSLLESPGYGCQHGQIRWTALTKVPPFAKEFSEPGRPNLEPHIRSRRRDLPEDVTFVILVKFQQRYQMRHRKSRDEDARWGFNSAISSF